MADALPADRRRTGWLWDIVLGTLMGVAGSACLHVRYGEAPAAWSSLTLAILALILLRQRRRHMEDEIERRLSEREGPPPGPYRDLYEKPGF